MVASHSDATGFEKSMIKYTFLEDDGNILMVRASNCKYLVALVYKNTIRIEKPGKFLKAKKHGAKTEIGSSLMEAEFKNIEGSYTYLEWPVLSETYIENPYFLTFDDQGRLRIYYVKEKSEEIVTEGEKYRCGCFSVDGREIYAINEQQEFCRINLRDLKTIVSKIKIPGLADPEKTVSRHISHVAPLIFAIGFIRKKTKNSIETFKPYFQIISGDIFDLNQELKMKEFSMPKINDNPVLFRSLYIKERQLLLFGHNESNKVHAVHFDFDGSINGLESLNLGKGTLRGMALLRFKPLIKGKMDRVEIFYQNKYFVVPSQPRIFVLDSIGYLQRFYYCDTRCFAPRLSMPLRPMHINDFNAKEETLRNRVKIKKSQWKSQSPRRNETKGSRRDSSVPADVWEKKNQTQTSSQQSL